MMVKDCDYVIEAVPMLSAAQCGNDLELWQRRYTQLRNKAADLDNHIRAMVRRVEKLRALRGEAFDRVRELTQ